MSRPTQAEVDAAIEHYREESVCGIERGCAAVLAAEVNALRNELEYERQLRTRLESELRELSARMLSNAEVLP